MNPSPLRSCFLMLTSLAFATVALGDDVSDLLTEAQRAYIRGDLTAAKEKFTLIRKLEPNNQTAVSYLRRIMADEQTQQAGKAPPTATEATLRKTILETVDLREASLAEALEFLRQKGNALTGGKAGINFVLQLDESAKTAKVTLAMQKVPFTEVLRYVGELAGVQFMYEPYAIVVRPKGGAPAGGKPADAAQTQGGIKIQGL